MISLSVHLKTVGTLLLLLSLAHFFFPRYFRWQEELRRVSLLTRQVFWVHYLFIMLVLALFGALSLWGTHYLLRGDGLSRAVLAGCAVFWLVRLFVQLFVYDRSLWQGQRFNTMMHVLFTATWTYFAAVYATAFFSS